MVPTMKQAAENFCQKISRLQDVLCPFCGRIEWWHGHKKDCAFAVLMATYRHSVDKEAVRLFKHLDPQELKRVAEG